MQNKLLLADIGGTHVRFATYDGEQTSVPQRYRTRAYFTFADAVQAYLSQNEISISGMIIGAAGIRRNNQVQLTNCPWIIDSDELKEIFHLQTIILLNDFSLQGLGVLQCAPAEYIPLGGTNKPLENGVRAVIGPGTGLGVCFLAADTGNRYQVYESEGGHISAAGVTVSMRALLEKAALKLPHVSYERFVSGTGLLFLYQIIGENYIEWAGGLLSEEIVRMQHAWNFVQSGRQSEQWIPVKTPPEITSLAEQGNEIALMTYWFFFAFLGVFCADMALSMKTTGGVYLVGDLLRNAFVLKLLQNSYVRQFFELKGRFSGFVSEIPLFFVNHQDIPIAGLTHIAQTVWKEE